MMLISIVNTRKTVKLQSRDYTFLVLTSDMICYIINVRKRLSLASFFLLAL